MDICRNPPSSIIITNRQRRMCGLSENFYPRFSNIRYGNSINMQADACIHARFFI